MSTDPTTDGTPVFGTPPVAGGTDGPEGAPFEIRLRPLEAADLRRVERLEQVLFGRSAWTYGMLADELGGLGRWYVAAEPERPYAAGRQDVVGYAGLWFDGDVTQVMTLGVDPEVQHQGVGRLLLEALISRSRDLRAEAVLLEVAVDNVPALNLYASYGFVQMGLRKKYYWPEGTDAYTMRLELQTRAAPSPGPVGSDVL
ncbi:ribosomal-protein-alanine acetyltransferase [Paraoerskovia sediminicola]|uniref:Ribosomal-protein-alanine acetyltransferase n=1 Tax=Paraoerskovia sediminicola TaxID=1138587 RepID=A0ABN6XCH5_9CELL|nr:ribosomal protein S18-alanine N-acetyltransferase [Paraoerskovia sediminicola]BDZ41153.1 ribosomal-protein-alanine acetyltransferase [Paraoerskovia sediminicola]